MNTDLHPKDLTKKLNKIAKIQKYVLIVLGLFIAVPNLFKYFEAEQVVFKEVALASVLSGIYLIGIGLILYYVLLGFGYIIEYHYENNNLLKNIAKDLKENSNK